ncbi:MAG TPA: hypothetical protein VIR79_01830 [Nitrospira sp.]
MRRNTTSRALLLLALTLAGTGEPIQALPQEGSPSRAEPQTISSMKVEGELVKIQGRYYVIKDSRGKELYLLVGPDTELAGPFKAGDRIEVFTSPIEHAIAIRATPRHLEEERIDQATRSLKGTLIGIEGKYYVVVGADGKEIRLLVNQDTELSGKFRPGEEIEVFTSPIEHAVAIKSAK